MPNTAEIKTIYSDAAKTNEIYPRTKVSAISDSNNTSLQTILDSKVATINNVAPDNNGNVGITAGTGIKINNNEISNVFDILSGVDLNDIKYNYQGYISGTNTNIPNGVSAAGYLVVIQRENNSTDYAMQMYSPYNIDDIYTRKLNNGTWGAWIKNVNCYKAGDTFTQYFKSAVITASATKFRVMLPLSRPVVSGTTATVTIGTARLYQDATKTLTNKISTVTSTVNENMIEIVVTTSESGLFTENVATTCDLQCTITFA